MDVTVNEQPPRMQVHFPINLTHEMPGSSVIPLACIILAVILVTLAYPSVILILVAFGGLFWFSNKRPRVTPALHVPVNAARLTCPAVPQVKSEKATKKIKNNQGKTVPTIRLTGRRKSD